MAAVDAVVHSDPEILGGTPVFRGTRVPLKNLVDYLAAGDTLDEFLDHFPSVKREQAMRLWLGGATLTSLIRREASPYIQDIALDRGTHRD
jgi:uncharacterized protein (DUF433 family)